ncbi:MAG: aldehyde dehydrogenase family protein [Candidatus Eremiobacteraeota bacterium]|nr:aldehyde dehydrogenase family protein [Candidatus Eremiobacteraeota bacterium]
MVNEYRMLIGGELCEGKFMREIRSPFSGEVVCRVPVADEADIEKAVNSAVSGFEKMKNIPSYLRAELLIRLRDEIKKRKEDFARSIALEAGKPVTDSRGEVDRACITLTLGSEEAKRIGGELIPLDLLPVNIGKFAITRRFPLGPILGITPFNFPLNLGMHKVAPALAAGNSIIWKPASQTPGTAFLFGEIFHEVCRDLDIPCSALNVISTPPEIAEKIARDDRIKMLTFTGSPAIGWKLKKLSGEKKVTLELGGNAGVIIGADADIDYAVNRCIHGGFSFAGQICISVQRIFIEKPVYEEFSTRLSAGVEKLKPGDPLDENTRIGPVISAGDAERIEQWINEAVKDNAKILTGGTRKGTLVTPTVLSDVKPDMKICRNEVFGPLVTVTPFENWEDAIAMVNDSIYGLQAGIFTRDIKRIFKAFNSIEVGGLIVNDIPTFRSDNMPYGGVKGSGMGREGLKYAIEEMTEPRLMVINT